MARGYLSFTVGLFVHVPAECASKQQAERPHVEGLGVSIQLVIRAIVGSGLMAGWFLL